MMLKLSSTQFAFERGDAYVMYMGEPGDGPTTELPPHEQTRIENDVIDGLSQARPGRVMVSVAPADVRLLATSVIREKVSCVFEGELSSDDIQCGLATLVLGPRALVTYRPDTPASGDVPTVTVGIAIPNTTIELTAAVGILLPPGSHWTYANDGTTVRVGKPLVIGEGVDDAGLFVFEPDPERQRELDASRSRCERPNG